MTSDTHLNYQEAYVWIWLPNSTEPVVAGLLTKKDRRYYFNYGRSYLARKEAIAIYAPELELKSEVIPLIEGLDMPGSIRDASPDAWGRRVLMNQSFSQRLQIADPVELNEIFYLLESGSDRIGALDFQLSPSQYIPRLARQATLEELLTATQQVERGELLSVELDRAIHHGSSIGGARPKVMIDGDSCKLIAKFSSSSDYYNAIKGEFIAMRLAAQVGLNVAPVHLTSALGKDILLIERFDREKNELGWCRKALVSALTILELDEMMANYASYENLTHVIRDRFSNPKATLKELFGRIVFNILCGNTDDHARNHAAFWDGNILTLTPAYDICPQSRTGEEASQGMLICGGDRRSRIATCLEAATIFLLSTQDAIAIVNQQITIIERDWQLICQEANLSPTEQLYFWGRQFCNPYAFYGAPEGVKRVHLH
jgi:serine/threonine-protein kinase HipA